MAETGSSSDIPATESAGEDGNSLILYHFYPSYYSQKVVFALHEKKLKFKSKILNLFNGQQFEGWFLDLNPKGEVPVLKDGVKVIPDSARIIDYLEDNFSNGDTPRLKPEKGSAQYQVMERFNGLLDKIQIGLITFGVLFHPELSEKMKMSPREIKARTGSFAQRQAQLEELIEKNDKYKDFYVSKKETLQKSLNNFQDVEQVKKALAELATVMDEVEKELASHGDDKSKLWLCGEKFTIADITLSIILNRLQALGQWNNLFGNSKRPNLHSYFKRVQQREAFRKTVNQSSGIMGTLCCMNTKEKLVASVASAMIVLGIAGLAAFLVQRKK